MARAINSSIAICECLIVINSKNKSKSVDILQTYMYLFSYIPLEKVAAIGKKKIK